MNTTSKKAAITITTSAFLLSLLVLTPALAHGWHYSRSSSPWHSPFAKQTTKPTTTGTVVTKVVATTTAAVVKPVIKQIVATTTQGVNIPAGESRFVAYITAYTYWDNTPPGSSDISNPVLHQKAGGTGTYADPITVAVGHSMTGGKDTLDYAAGTRFYVPNLHKYFMVEDTCGDGNTPQNGPCHSLTQAPKGVVAWLDLWIDGASGNRASTDSCANAITDAHLVIKNPASNYAAIAGPVYNNGCVKQFGDSIVTN